MNKKKLALVASLSSCWDLDAWNPWFAIVLITFDLASLFGDVETGSINHYALLLCSLHSSLPKNSLSFVREHYGSCPRSSCRGNSCEELSSEAAFPLQNIDSHGCLICPWLKESVTNMWINFFYMRPKFKKPHVAMKSCSPQAFLSYFAPVVFISFASRNAKALKLFSITSYSGVHILCFKEP